MCQLSTHTLMRASFLVKLKTNMKSNKVVAIMMPRFDMPAMAAWFNDRGMALALGTASKGNENGVVLDKMV